VAACAWTGFAAAEPVDTLPVGTGRDGEVDDEEPGLWWIGIGYKYLLDNYTEFQIAWIGSFVLHEVAYFGAYIPWLIIDNIPYCRRYKIQVTEYNPPVKQWECFKKLMFAHVFVQFPLMAFFHIVAIEYGGMSMGMPLPSVTTLAWQIPVFFAYVSRDCNNVPV